MKTKIRFVLTLLSLIILIAGCLLPPTQEPERVLTVEISVPQNEIDQGHIFDLKLTLSNPGKYNVHVSQVILPAEIMNASRYVGSEPALTLKQNQTGEGLVEMDLTIAPVGTEILLFRFEANQSGLIRGQGSVVTDNKTYPFQAEVQVVGVNPEGWQPGVSPAQTPIPLGRIPWQAVVQIEAVVDVDGRKQVGWSGSGTIISKDGLILTNAHVVLSDRFYRVVDLIVSLTVADDAPPVQSYYASIVQADNSLDIAIIKPYADMNNNPINYDLLNLPFVPLGNSNDLELGESINILGYPGIGGRTITLTSGEVSGFTAEDPYGNRAFIKTSGTIAGGNSGGLAVNSRGELIGVPTEIGSGDLGNAIVDCRALLDTNRDGYIDDNDSCVPTGGFINALRPINLATDLITAARNGEVTIATDTTVGESFDHSGEVIFEDDFSDPNSGWDSVVDEAGTAKYEDGEYTISVTEPMYFIYADQEYLYDSIFIETELRVVDSVGDGDFGFICGLRGDELTVLEISEDGYYSIWKQSGSEVSFLVDWEYSQEVAAGGPFQLGAQCGRDELILVLNGQVLARAVDQDYLPGSVGMMAGTFDNPGIKVAFDNLKIMIP